LQAAAQAVLAAHPGVIRAYFGSRRVVEGKPRPKIRTEIKRMPGMKKISGKMFAQKILLPIIFAAMPTIFLFTALQRKEWDGASNLRFFPFLIFPIAGYFTYRRYSKFMDEVFDCGDYLVVKRKDLEDNISLSNISNIGYSSSSKNSRLVTLKLRKECVFGGEVSFEVKDNDIFKAFKKNEIIEDLLVRVEKIRDHAKK
jgi:hypothetical protein